MKKWVAMVLLAALASGCGTMSDKQKTQAQGAGIGALLGAGLGAIIGNQMGDPAMGAMIGATLGGAAGLMYGDHVAGKKEQFASQEDYLDACIAEARKSHDEVKQYNDVMRTEIAQLDQELDALLAARDQHQADAKALKGMRQNLQEKIAASEEQLAALNDEITVQRQVLAQEEDGSDAGQIARLREEIDRLEEQKAELQEGTRQLASLNNRASA